MALRVETQTIGTSVEGRAIDAVKLGTGEACVVVIAGIHGSEPAGVALAQRLRVELERTPEAWADRRVAIVPAANPDGLAVGERLNARGVDLNRNFPAANHNPKGAKHGETPLSEPESLALHNWLLSLPRVDRVVTLHQPLACVDYDGPEARTLPLAEALAEASGLPLKRLGSRPGSMGSWLGVDRQTPTITLEFLRCDSELDDDALWQRYGRAVRRSVAFPILP